MSPPRTLKLISVVIPIFNERLCIPELVWRLGQVFQTESLQYEIIFVDDASTDGGFAVLQEIARKNPSVRGIRFSKNRGQQIAWSAGLQMARGDVVVMMDGDLQHPPELIPDLLEAWREGYDIVNTQKLAPAQSTWSRGILSRLFYRLFNSLSDELKLEASCSDFRLLDRKCVRALNQFTERLKFYRGLVEYIGFNQKTISFRPPPRHAGEPKFTWRLSLGLALDAISNYSTIGLKLPIVLGAVIFFSSLTYLSSSLFLEFWSGNGFVRGWPSIVALTTVFFGAQFLFLGVIGVYVGKIFMELKNRPAFFVADSIGPGFGENLERRAELTC